VSAPEPDATQTMASRRFLLVLVLAAVVGVVAALAAWCFLELTHQLQVGVFEKLPEQFGYDTAPVWWPLPAAALGGLVVAFAIARLPGRGGHLPANGLSTGVTLPIAVPGVLLAGLATIAFGLVLGPEAPLIAMGGGLGLLGVRLLRRDAPAELRTLIAACGTFSALALIFDSPLIAAVVLIEAAGVGGPQLKLLIVPGLLAAGIGSLVSIGMGAFTGLSSSAYAIGALPLPVFARPDAVDFLWTLPLAAAIALGAFAIFRVARAAEPIVTPRLFLALPAAGLVVAGLAIAFSQLTDKGVDEVLFSGQDDLPGLIAGAGTWSLGALALLIALKGLAWAISLASFRGGPTFPAMFLGAAAGLMASHLPGYALTPAVAVGIGAGVAAVLRLPLSAVVLALLLTAKTGAGSSPLVILGVVTAYLTTLALTVRAAEPAEPGHDPDGMPSRPTRSDTVAA
jgi:H+/Cl- antiporter ClcA